MLVQAGERQIVENNHGHAQARPKSSTQPRRNATCRGWLQEQPKRRSEAIRQPVMQALLKTARGREPPRGFESHALRFTSENVL